MRTKAREEKMIHRIKKYLKRESAFKEDRRLEKLDWLPGSCKFGLCGEDAACVPGPNSTHKCVCPSDLSVPTTEDKLCLTRKTVPLTPRPILNINVSGRSIAPSHNGSAIDHQAEDMTAGKNELQPGGGFIIGLFAFIMFIAILLGTFFWWKKKTFLKCFLKTNRSKNDMNPSPLSLSKGLLGSYVPNPQYMADDLMPVPVLSRDTLLFVQEIGEGCFGKVFKGELKKEDGTFQTVAIKVLKESASKQAEEDFMREVEIMSSFRHENILSLIGIVLKGSSYTTSLYITRHNSALHILYFHLRHCYGIDPRPKLPYASLEFKTVVGNESTSRPWMVFEFMMYGDLAEVLRSNSRQFWKPVPGMKPLTKESLLKIALQIAGGMKYLASQRFVHNDLACRNCLVGSELTVKIADFGMSRDIYTCDYYRIGGSKPVPLRWMSPESVMYRRFTLESDVWSYGVVLWEIYSLGKQPYYGLSNEEVVKMIFQGVMLIPPDGCPPFICGLMRACWKSEPKDRIKFPDIYDVLKKAWKEKEAEHFAGVTSPSCKNENVIDTSEASLPRPPIFPVTPFQSDHNELLDSDNYLAPQAAQVNEYLQPLPD